MVKATTHARPAQALGSSRASRTGCRRAITQNRGLAATGAILAALLSAICPAAGCKPASDAAAEAPKTVTVYCSVDEAFARTVLERYERQSGIRPQIVFDSEAGKTTGLVRRIVAEARSGGTGADVFWSSELFNTIALARLGVLEPYDSPAASDIPPRYRDTDHLWTALAARGRVITFNPAKLAAAALPTRWDQLAEPKFAAMTTIANPLFGTTRGHVAAMFALWGPERAAAFLTNLRDGGLLLSDGNSSAVRAVIADRAKIAATDTDDVWVAQLSGASLDLRYLDMGDGGTLMIPCSVAIIKKCRHGDSARELVDFLVSEEVERLLAESDSRNVPVRPALREQLGMAWPPETHVAFDAIADALEESERAVREILIR